MFVLTKFVITTFYNILKLWFLDQFGSRCGQFYHLKTEGTEFCCFENFDTIQRHRFVICHQVRWFNSRWDRFEENCDVPFDKYIHAHIKFAGLCDIHSFRVVQNIGLQWARFLLCIKYILSINLCIQVYTNNLKYWFWIHFSLSLKTLDINLHPKYCCRS